MGADLTLLLPAGRLDFNASYRMNAENSTSYRSRERLEPPICPGGTHPSPGDRDLVATQSSRVARCETASTHALKPAVPVVQRQPDEYTNLIFGWRMSYNYCYAANSGVHFFRFN